MRSVGARLWGRLKTSFFSLLVTVRRKYIYQRDEKGDNNKVLTTGLLETLLQTFRDVGSHHIDADSDRKKRQEELPKPSDREFPIIGVHDFLNHDTEELQSMKGLYE